MGFHFVILLCKLSSWLGSEETIDIDARSALVGLVTVDHVLPSQCRIVPLLLSLPWCAFFRSAPVPLVRLGLAIVLPRVALHRGFPLPVFRSPVPVEPVFRS